MTFLAAMVLLACAVQLGRFLADVNNKARVGKLMKRNSKLFDDLNAERLKNQNLELQIKPRKTTAAVDIYTTEPPNDRQSFNATLPKKSCPECDSRLFKPWVNLKEPQKVTWECLNCRKHFGDGEL